MHYGMAGEFLGASREPAGIQELRNVRDVLWASAEPFSQWWARHPELHRERRRAA
jgi:hypothetical protein